MKKILTVVFLIFFVVGAGWAQEPAEETKTETAQVEEVVVASMPEPGMITFSFKDADIKNVMRLIAAKAVVNIVYGPEVTGVVNMELKDVPWEQALSLVLDLNGYAYQKEGNVIKVLQKDALDKEPLSTEVFILNYALAETAGVAVEQMLSERGSIKTDARSNTIIVTDIPANINKVEIVLAKIDSRTPQVLIETKVVEMKNTFEKDLGLKWASLKAYTVKFQDPSRTYRSIRRGGEGYWDNESEKADADGGISQYTDNKQRDIVSTADEGTLTDTTTIQLIDSITKSFTRTLLKADIRSAVLSADDFELVLSALETEGDVTLLSSPRIITANNEPAQIRIVDEYPVPDYEFDTETSQWSITGFSTRDIGVTFSVTPNVSADGYVTMKIAPKVTKLIGEIPFSAGGATVFIPYIAVKEASSKMMVRSGDTLAVGGLIDEDKKGVVTKIPLLGDIPVLGRLFSHNDVDNVKKDIIFFITATVIDKNTMALVTEPPVDLPKEKREKYSKYFKAQNIKTDQSVVAGNQGYISKN